MPSPVAILPKTIHKIQGEDPILNRFQDHLVTVLTAFMRQVVEQLGVVPAFDLGSRPAADARYAGSMIRLRRPGFADDVQVCLANENGVYSWQSLSSAVVPPGPGPDPTPDPATAWAELGVWVAATPPTTTITYAQWVSGSTGYWAWVQV